MAHVLEVSVETSGGQVMFHTRRGLSHLGLAMAFTGAVACGQSNQAKPIDFNANGFEGFESTQFGLLAAPCSFDNTTGNMTVTLGANETGYLFKRASDGSSAEHTSEHQSPCNLVC